MPERHATHRERSRGDRETLDSVSALCLAQVYRNPMSIFDDFLERHELKDSELVWDSFKKALACFDEETKSPESVAHKPLFTILREGMSSGDERNFAGVFSDTNCDDAVLYFADDAGGIGRLWRVSKHDGSTMQAKILEELDDWGWGPLQIYDTTISNFSRDLVPRSFFVRLVEEAFNRHPDLIDADDEITSSPDLLVEEIYEEW